MPTTSSWRWLPSLMLLLGCSTTLPPIPITAKDFQLEIRAEWDQVGSGDLLDIHHRLTNRSTSAGCVGGHGAFLMNGKPLISWSVSDAVCGHPLRIVQPGDTLEWSMPWSGYRCMEDAPEGFLEAFPWLRCGTVVELESMVSVLSWPRDHPPWERADVTSPPQEVRLAAGAPIPDKPTDE